jgi:hypothetical protein
MPDGAQQGMGARICHGGHACYAAVVIVAVVVTLRPLCVDGAWC